MEPDANDPTIEVNIKMTANQFQRLKELIAREAKYGYSCCFWRNFAWVLKENDSGSTTKEFDVTAC